MEEALIKRVMPNSIAAEQSVIASMIMDQDAITIASQIVTAEDFYQKQYGAIFEAITDLYAENKPVDLVTLQNRLKEKGVPPEISSLEFMGDVIASVPVSTNVRAHAQIVAEKALLRRLIHVNEEIANAC